MQTYKVLVHSEQSGWTTETVEAEDALAAAQAVKLDFLEAGWRGRVRIVSVNPY